MATPRAAAPDRKAPAGRTLRRKLCRALGFALLLPAMSVPAAEAPAGSGSVIRVGPNRAVRTIAEAARLARDGSVVEIDAGDYPGDVAIWAQDRLTVRSRGDGAVRLVANGQSAEGKAIWVVRGGDILVEGITFTGARVPDLNGAGIRFEKGRLTVRNCRFLDNENGILASNREDAELIVEGSEFGHNGAVDGRSHNLYAGTIRRLVVSSSYFHHARVGHLLKSRARESDIRYNRLTDEAGGRASYELEFPNGGQVTVVGNVISQERSTENPHLLAYGAEGYRWPANAIAVVHNTFIDERSGGGIFFRFAPGAITSSFVNNLYVGNASLAYPQGARRFGDARVRRDDLADPDQGDFRLKDNERTRDLAIPLPPELKTALLPVREYRHPRTLRELKSEPVLPGAYQR